MDEDTLTITWIAASGIPTLLVGYYLASRPSPSDAPKRILLRVFGSRLTPRRWPLVFAVVTTGTAVAFVGINLNSQFPLGLVWLLSLVGFVSVVSTVSLANMVDHIQAFSRSAKHFQLTVAKDASVSEREAAKRELLRTALLQPVDPILMLVAFTTTCLGVFALVSGALANAAVMCAVALISGTLRVW